jgi:Domain of unknown function (DUF4307)
MAERYGVTPPRRRLLAVAALAVAGVVLLGWLAWSAWVQGTTSVSGQVVSFDVVSPHRIDVTVQISHPADAAAQCTLEAQAVDHTVVGQVLVSVPAGEGAGKVTSTIKTDREATSATVTGCH